MENYREYLPELKSTTIFQDIADDDLIALLEAMGPKISHKKAGEGHGPLDKHDFNTFKILLRATPAPPWPRAALNGICPNSASRA